MNIYIASLMSFYIFVNIVCMYVTFFLLKCIMKYENKSIYFILIPHYSYSEYRVAHPTYKLIRYKNKIKTNIFSLNNLYILCILVSKPTVLTIDTHYTKID